MGSARYLNSCAGWLAAAPCAHAMLWHPPAAIITPRPVVIFAAIYVASYPGLRCGVAGTGFVMPRRRTIGSPR